MRRAVAVVAALAVGGLLVLGLAELTLTRPDQVEPGTATRVVFTVGGGTFRGSLDEGAIALWAACRGTIPGELDVGPVRPAGGGKYQAVVEPALGRHATDRLRGCLRDVTIDRLRGEVIEFVRVDR